MSPEEHLTAGSPSFIRIINTPSSGEYSYLATSVFISAEPSSSEYGMHPELGRGGRTAVDVAFDVLWGLLAAVVVIFTFYVSLMCCLIYQRHKINRRPSDELLAAARNQAVGRIRGIVRSFAEGMRRQSEAVEGLGQQQRQIIRGDSGLEDVAEEHGYARGSTAEVSSYATAMSQGEQPLDQKGEGRATDVEGS